MGRRSGLLITGLVVAALGTLLVFLYTSNVERTVQGDAEVVNVYIATDPVGVGTPIDGVKMEQKSLPQAAVPAGAITDPATVAGLLSVVPIAPQQVLLASMFGQPAQVTSLEVPEGKMGVAVQLDDAQRVAGFVNPGSEVAVFATIAGADGKPSTNLLLPRATVAAVGPTTVVSRTSGQGEAANTEQIPTAILTLALDQAEAQKLIFASDQSRLYFALLTPKSVTAPGPGVSAQNLF